MQRKLAFLTLIAMAASIALVVLPWFYTFHDAPLSTTPADWGVFGDYFGGVLSTLVSIFGFLALLITIRIQRDAMEMQMGALKAQWTGIEQERETRDDEVYYRHALQCFDEALTALSDPEDGALYRNRVAWLQSARLILTAKELAAKITGTSICIAYKASEKLIRSRFQSRLDPVSNPETLQPTYFCGPNWDDFFQNRVSDRLEKHSVYVVYKFASWGRDEVDLIDSVVGNIHLDEISEMYRGAKFYLDDQPATTP